MKKKLTVVAALVLVLAMGVGGTLAYLTDQTAAVTNTFTVGNVKIELTETNATKGNDGILRNSYKMIPGDKIAKDPKVTVKKDSEACWLFVKVEGSTTLDSYISYTVDSGWVALTGADGVYYKKQAATTADTTYSVLTSDQVTVKTDVTQAMMDGLSKPTAVQPTLTFTAYAIQQANIGTDKTSEAEKAAAAWAELNPTT